MKKYHDLYFQETRTMLKVSASLDRITSDSMTGSGLNLTLSHINKNITEPFVVVQLDGVAVDELKRIIEKSTARQFKMREIRLDDELKSIKAFLTNKNHENIDF